ncbi:MAG: SUMF1/EgtB/PvdO family nonheme iron enzyme [Deltaproteobacteria bacterium]|nr:SUMF1/EgtB/PvdO family nonheme iron enzyme [Deltaproteobacteria bacterium]
MKRSLWWSCLSLAACLDAEADFPRAIETPCAELSCPTAMVAVVDPSDVTRTVGGLSVNGSCICVDAYEASRGPGDVAVSAPGVRPWVGLNFDQATAACEAAGKRLCTGAEWTAACTGIPAFPFPYGESLDPKACNTTSTVALTGAYPGCEGGAAGLFDLSGNVAEWAAEPTRGCDLELGCATFGGGWDAPEAELACGYRAGFGRDQGHANVGFRCCRSP